ncbi:helix-turn-helix domain-containing protein [Peribacillus sp. SI8-4]|uniref:PucR family transcriptional regulator n=1 Tax=Peribacillus sp. SI8-4 TaxID=3048009 RepID=UPI0025577D04|nr:helix-turn-helix domain-containing protein [Peribacillus sp. SI8-4]
MDKSKQAILKSDIPEIQIALYIQELVEVLSLNLGLQQLMDRSREILGHPMVLHDMGFKVLAASYDAHEVVNFIHDDHGNKYINEDTIEFIRSNNVAGKVRKKGTSEYIEKLEPLNGTLLSIIKINDIEIAQFAVYEAAIKFEEFDFKLIDKITQLLSVELQKSNAFQIDNSLIPNYVVTDLLDGKIMTEDAVRDKLHYLHWIHEEAFYVMVLSDADHKALDMKIPAVVQVLKEFIPLENCIIFQSNITAFISKKLYTKLCSESNSVFEDFLQTNALRAGISLEFSEVSACKRYYTQAKKALEIGRKQNSTLSFFKESALEIIYELITSNYNFVDFCHPAVMELLNYDQCNHTDLLPTLKNYLHFMSSPNEAAKVLCIHRNTLFYRINKIKDMTGINLKDVTEISQLYFSIRLLEIDGY